MTSISNLGDEVAVPDHYVFGESGVWEDQSERIFPDCDSSDSDDLENVKNENNSEEPTMIVNSCNVKVKMESICADSNDNDDHHESPKSPSLVCSVCGLTFKFAVHLKQHLEVHRPATLKCRFCGKLYKLERNLQEHLKEHFGQELLSDDGNVQCKDFSRLWCMLGDECVDIGRSSQELVIPEKESECGKEVKNKQHLKLHMTAHYHERLYECDICGGRYKAPAYLRKHIRTTHNDVCICAYCNKVFANNSDLEKHTLSTRVSTKNLCVCAEDTKSIQQNSPSERCRNSVNLKFKSNNGGKEILPENQEQLTCKVCRRDFRHIPAFKAHMIVHENKQSLKCLLCERTFAKNYHLVMHVRAVHGNLKKQTCSDCGRSFKNSYTLQCICKKQPNTLEGPE